MSAFVEECRQEWKKLGVPDVLAEEMASELEADLADAEADGITAAELLGESDPQLFAAAWARERGLVAESPPERSRKRLWIALAACVVLACVALSTLALIRVGEPAHAATPVKVPRLVGLKACDAVRVGHLAGLGMLHTVYKGRCDALVISQKPAAGTYVALHAPTTLRLSLVRIPHLVGRNTCDVKVIAGRAGIFIRKAPDGRGLPKSSRCVNYVVGQTPAAGQIVHAPGVVTIQVGPATS
jgi:hypothetical protein